MRLHHGYEIRAGAQFIKNRLDVYEAAPKDTKDMSKEQLASTISESMYFA